jgi:hypothetical protein
VLGQDAWVFSSPPSLSSNSILCLAVDGRKSRKGNVGSSVASYWFLEFYIF